MRELPLRTRIFEAVSKGDLVQLRRFIADSPDAVTKCYGEDSMLHHAAAFGQVEVMQALVCAGMHVDLRCAGNPHTPLHRAAAQGRLHAVLWLVDNGAELCAERATSGPTPLVSAAANNHIDIVRLLVDRGADVNATYRSQSGEIRNALTQAIRFGHQEIADYLRSKGATEPQQPAMSPQDMADRIFRHMADHVGKPLSESLQEIVPSELPVAIHVIPATRKRPFVTLFTTGMSQRKMHVPEGSGYSDLGELFIRLPPEWPTGPEALADSRWSWPFIWLRRITRAVHENQSHAAWLVFSTAEPPEPVAPDTTLSAFLSLECGDLGRLEVGDGTLAFYEVSLLHKRERDYALEHGADQLLQRLIEANASPIVDLHRESIV